MIQAVKSCFTFLADISVRMLRLVDEVAMSKYPLALRAVLVATTALVIALAILISARFLFQLIMVHQQGLGLVS